METETKSERLHQQKRKVKVQEKRVAEETHLVYDSLCERKQVGMCRTSAHGPKYMKVHCDSLDKFTVNCYSMEAIVTRPQSFGPHGWCLHVCADACIVSVSITGG